MARLKPNAALLLSVSIESVYNILYKRIKIDNVHLYTNSKIALAWINKKKLNYKLMYLTEWMQFSKTGLGSVYHRRTAQQT